MKKHFTASPEAQGMDSAKLAHVFDEIIGGKFCETHGVYAARGGELVFETYFYPYTSDTRHNVFSVTKSLTSALIGIAIKQGLLEGVHRRVFDFFPEHAGLNTDARKDALTIEHVLTMTGGFAWEDGSDLRACVSSGDWAGYVLSRPMAEEPGTVYCYNTGGSHLLTAILNKVIGMPTAVFAERYLFGPLGITEYYWSTDPQGILTGGFGAHLKPSDMVKFGQLYLNEGLWQGSRIVTDEWVRTSTRKWTDNGYGYHWWVFEEERRYAASGYGGQYVHVVPDANLVVAVTNGGGYELPIGLFTGAIVSDGPLPANPEAQALLEMRALLAEQAPVTTTIGLPDMAKRITGRTLRFEPSRCGIETLMFDFEPGRPLEGDVVIGIGGVVQRYSFGLDNRYRVSVVRPNIDVPADGIALVHDFATLLPRLLPAYTVGRRGSWLDESTFVLHNEGMETGFRQQMTFRFDGDSDVFSVEVGIPSYEDVYTVAAKWDGSDGRA
ncbi:serine hydrolase domain-containing protein [Paenibacillus silvisoli]|uniref:serine hydrolase domain-containing protein n=1 Tax=Paenibacillus silvisoli TaxID=3110539 RepID=UPI0028044472|nr:serine hydrolase [Paenibacillus silvisoli]